jgi:hypothetical protein
MKKGLSPEDFARARAEALYGNRGQLPGIFNHDPRYDKPIF